MTESTSGVRADALTAPPDVRRPVRLILMAIGVAVVGIAGGGWVWPSLGLGAIIAMIGLLLVVQVHRCILLYSRASACERRAAMQAERHYVDVLGRIVRFVEGRDKFYDGHSGRVGDMCEQLARRLRLPADTCRRMSLAGQLHDIGLLAISDSVMKVPTRLGPKDLRALRKHPEVAYEVLRPLASLEGILGAVRHHHERMNGTGYPDGLSGQTIPLTARILAVADAYDGMTHDRPHRPAMPMLAAVQELRRCCPEGYDPACVEALAQELNVPAMEGVAETPVNR